MRTGTCIVVLTLVLLSLEGFARAENWLQGQVFENHGNTKKPALGAQVWIVNVGNPFFTKLDGGYRVLVPDAYRVGQTIVLYVKRKGWAIATPIGGKVELKEDFKSDIFLLPEPSPEFLSPAQLDKLLERLPEKLKSQVKPDVKEGSTDPEQVVREYATEHGLPEQEVLANVAALVKQYEQSSDLGKQCLAAVYQKNLKQAATRCEQNATSKVDLLKKKRQEVEALSKSQLKSDRSVEPSFVYESGEIILVTDRAMQLRADPEPRASRDTLFVEAGPGKSTPAQIEEGRRQLIKLTEEVVGEFKSTGDTYYANYQFDKALVSYNEGLSYVEKKDLPTLWADMQWTIGLADWQIGIRTKEAAIQENLAEAVNRYKEAQSVYTQSAFPEAWAAIENNLGAVLSEQGIRTGGEKGTRLLAQAVAAYRAALTVRTKEQLPQDWATTQNNLGAVLREQGTRTGGEAGTQLLAQAVAAYRAALEIRTREHLPEGWAQTHNNLAKSALALEDWPTAAESYRNVLTLYPDYNEAYQITNGVYHDKLFAYTSAFELSKQWLDRHPADVSAQANFAEAHLTTGRYGEAEHRLGELLKKPDLDPNAWAGLRIVDVVTALALKKANIVPQKLQELRTFVSGQPESFHPDWSFDGTTHFVQTEQVFAPHRAWLMELFAVVKSKDRAALLAALDHVQSSFKP
ncbi:MAG: tetratricopeptide repeat protein [Nitrospira sp.]|nr:tetratricopeptide repeat protein [Nitrospira sp.]